MSRPRAETIISTQVDDRTGIDILVAPGIYAILYQGKPINIRQRVWCSTGELPEYLRTSFSSPAPANNLAKKLNEYFFTEDFKVVKIL